MKNALNCRIFQSDMSGSSDHNSLLEDALNLLRAATELEESSNEDHRIEAATKVSFDRCLVMLV